MAAPLRLRIPEVADPDLAVDARVHDSPKPAEVRIVGSAEANAKQPLKELFDRLHDELVHKRVPEVIVDLRALDAMGGGCMNVLIAWLGRVQEAPEEERYKIRFQVNRAVAWQSGAIKALSCFDTDLVVIEGGT